MNKNETISPEQEVSFRLQKILIKEGICPTQETIDKLIKYITDEKTIDLLNTHFLGKRNKRTERNKSNGLNRQHSPL